MLLDLLVSESQCSTLGLACTNNPYYTYTHVHTKHYSVFYPADSTLGKREHDILNIVFNVSTSVSVQICMP